MTLPTISINIQHTDFNYLRKAIVIASESEELANSFDPFRAFNFGVLGDRKARVTESGFEAIACCSAYTAMQ